jgi:Uma2 family endonuclease
VIEVSQMAHSRRPTLSRKGIFYPDTDGEPMAESDFQRKPLTYLVEALDLYFQERSDVYVSGNLLVHYKEGNPNVSVAPDVFVVFGVPKRDRRVYQVWVEGKGPDVVIEITSRATQERDEIEKPVIYQSLGVKEYFQYDPTGDYLQPALRRRRLDEQGAYRPITESPLLGGGLSLDSPLLRLALRLEGGQLRLFNPAMGEYLLTHREEAMARREAGSRIKALEAELARLRARGDP